MQELALLISSLAGAASAVAVHKIPRGPRTPTIGASGRVRAEIQNLESERGLLEKAVARLYDGGGIPSAKRDALLEMYQARLSEIRARIGDLKAAGSHPDLGPLGDSLIMLMDQKLSGLDARLRELSSKMQAPRQEKAAEKPAPKPRAEPKRAPEPAAGDKSLDMVTLTVHSAGAAAGLAAGHLAVRPEPPAAPPVQAHPEPEPPAQAQPEIPPEPIPAEPPVQAQPEPEIPAEPEPETLGSEYDDENLDSLKKDILTALEQIEQAEVE